MKPNPQKIKRIKNNIEATKTQMVKNVELLLERGEKLEVLKESTQKLERSSEMFSKKALKIRQNAKDDNLMMTFILIGGFVGFLIPLLAGLYWPLIFAGFFAGSAMGYVFDRVRRFVAKTFYRPIDSERLALPGETESTASISREEKGADLHFSYPSPSRLIAQAVKPSRYRTRNKLKR